MYNFSTHYKKKKRVFYLGLACSHRTRFFVCSFCLSVLCLLESCNAKVIKGKYIKWLVKSFSNLSASFHLIRSPGTSWNEIQQLKEASSKYSLWFRDCFLLLCMLKDIPIIPRGVCVYVWIRIFSDIKHLFFYYPFNTFFS